MIKITIEGSDFADVLDGVYLIDEAHLESFYIETTEQSRLRDGAILTREKRLVINALLSERAHIPYVVRIVNIETGEVVCEEGPFDFDRAQDSADEIYDGLFDEGLQIVIAEEGT